MKTVHTYHLAHSPINHVYFVVRRNQFGQTCGGYYIGYKLGEDYWKAIKDGASIDLAAQIRNQAPMARLPKDTQFVD